MRPPSTSSVTTHGRPRRWRRPGRSGTPAAQSAATSRRPRRQRHDQQAVGPVPAGEAGEVLVAVDGRLDVEQHEVVAAVPQGGDRAPEPLDGGGVGEERDDDAEGLAPARATGRGPAGSVGTPSSSMAASTRARASALTFGRSFRTRDTVPAPTPARAATIGDGDHLPRSFNRVVAGPLAGTAFHQLPRNLSHVRWRVNHFVALRRVRSTATTSENQWALAFGVRTLGVVVDVDDAEPVGDSPGPTRSCRAATTRSSRAGRRPRSIDRHGAARRWPSRKATRSASSNGVSKAAPFSCTYSGGGS